MSQTARDLLSKPGAERLVRTITAYWRAKGSWIPTVWAEPVKTQLSDTQSEMIWRVRSDMVGGKPVI